MKNVYVTLLFLVACSASQIFAAKNPKKSLKTTKESTEETVDQPAIIAIEIVDPNENSTNSKNSKRTIENALGYGYNSYDTSKPRYEIYKYSQHDIPAYKPDPSEHYTPSPGPKYEIQQSLQYQLPSVTEHIQGTKNALRPGTTLYSSLSANGQVGGLKSSLSQVSGLEHNQAPVPVVVLRIYPNQLKDSTIQANLPESHPFAKAINSVNIQSLLLHYIKALQNPSAATQYFEQPQKAYPTSPTYSAPTTHKTASDYNAYYTQEAYQKPAGYQTGNEEAENYQYYHQSYPKETAYQQQNQQQYQQQEEDYSEFNNGVQVQEVPIKYQFKFQSPTTSKQPVKAPEVQQYYYVQPTAQTTYSTEPTNYYQSEYSKQQSQAPQGQQYYTTNEQQQYQDYYQGSEEQQYVSPKLLTNENYPTSKHTRVVFRTKSGNVRTPENEEIARKQIKTIKIQVPDNIAKVEVQETEQPYQHQSYPEEYRNVEQPADDYEQDQRTHSNGNNYYNVQQDNYNTADSPPNENYNYQNVDYDQMVKYFARRGAMPSYFYRNTENEEGGDQRPLSTEEMAAAYEEASFPATTKAPQKKKVKSKKRI